MPPAFARIHLSKLASGVASPSTPTGALFHVRRAARDEIGFADTFFSVRGDVVFADLAGAHRFASAINRTRVADRTGPELVQASQLNAMGLIHEVFHVVVARYRAAVRVDVFGGLLARLRAEHGEELDRTLRAFIDTFPPPAVYSGAMTPIEWLGGATDGISNTQWALEEMLLAWLNNENPALSPMAPLVGDADLRRTTSYLAVIGSLRRFFDEQPRFGPSDQSLVDMLLSPIRHAPGSLVEQLEYMRTRWGLDVDLLRKILLASDFVKEEGKWFFRKAHGVGDESPPPPVFRGEYYDHEPERFSADRDWMPRVVMIAKSTFVWLDQLSRTYGRPMHTLADIPDEELDRLAARGFTALWLIGIWKRSVASVRIKQRMGNAEAVASAYSLADYDIAPELGGWEAYENLRDRAMRRGVRLASDMVPNHMGIDSRWLIEHPDWFVQSREPPFPNYSFTGPDLCDDPRVGVVIEDGYWTKTDAAVTFKRFDKHTGDVRYVYHGNDGTSMPWNDTAQLDYTKGEVREAVIQTILHVARLFPIIRFDAAMTLAKRHYQRLWFPVPGSGGDIPSRAAFAMTKERFDEVFPVEFWREVVDRVAEAAPDTLLLAEAFWLMEGYFVRTLGMHRVYNSAFMNMLRKEENANYRSSIKNVLLFNPQILKRHVNFMNNPDEETAVAQFGRDDKYFGVCTVMCTMPGLPMFGHGQIEGFSEKYGMEYKRAYWDERPDEALVRRHEREISPLLHARPLFSDVERFTLYDVFTEAGFVDEDVFAYSNMRGSERALVVYHNKFKETRGWIRTSVGFMGDAGNTVQRTLGEGLDLDTRSGVFTIFRDHTTGLEHIRDNRELWEKGLYVELGAFKYHVFWRFRQVTHTADAPWGDLARQLAGRGVPSMAEALVDLVHAPLHEAFVRAVATGTIGEQLPVPGEAKEMLARRFAAIEGEPGERWVRAWALSDALGSWFDRAGLDRAMLRAWREVGEPEERARTALALVRIALRVRTVEDASEAAGALLDDAWARAFLDVHTHDGVEWLRKEPLEELARALEAMQRADAPEEAPEEAPGEETTEREPRERGEAPEPEAGSELCALAARAGYRVDLLRDLLGATAPPTARVR